MGYYIRVLGTRLDHIPLADLRAAAHPAVIESEDDDAAWTEFVVAHEDGTEIAVVERNLVEEDELGG